MFLSILKSGSKKGFRFFLLFLFSLSCTSTPRNNVTYHHLHINGGVSAYKKWDDPLKLKRYSWYHGLTLYYDIFITQADKESNFSLWFSDSERELLDECPIFLVALQYAADPLIISHVRFKTQMEANGFEDRPIPEYAAALKAHPDYSRWNLQRYRIMGYCHKTGLNVDKKIQIHFPSFNSRNIAFGKEK